MANSTTSNVYIHVIEDVINKVRQEFNTNGGPGENVLSELQGTWEMKMMQAEAILAPIDRSSAAKSGTGGPIPVHDLNVPYEGTEEYETPTTDMLFPPTPMQTPMPTPLPGMAQTPLPGTAQTPLPGTVQTPMTVASDSSLYNIPTGTPITPNEYSSANDIAGLPDVKPGRPNPYMQPPPQAYPRPRLDVNVAYVGDEGDRGGSHQPATQDFFMMGAAGKRKRDDFPPQYPNGGYIPQQDGASGSISEELKIGLGLSNNASNSKAGMFSQGGRLFSNASQVDGPAADPYHDELSTPNIYNYQGGANDDYQINTPATNELQQAATPAAIVQNDNVEEDDGDDEPLNEDDDDEYDDVDQGDDLNTSHLVLAQFDKVTRTKSRWKCTLKDGIMHINNKDILFNKASGEFDF